MTTSEFIKNFIFHPARTVEILKEKSRLLPILLLIINAPVFGLLYFSSHFIANLAIGIFWIFGSLIGIVLFIGVISYLVIYYLIAKLFKEENVGSSVKIIGYYYILAYSLYHLIMIPIYVALLISFNYYFVVLLYNYSHLILLFWIIALSTQGIYQLQKDSEFRSMLKIFSSFFISYIIVTIFELIAAAELISQIIR
jgi:hypothetical protein